MRAGGAWLDRAKARCCGCGQAMRKEVAAQLAERPWYTSGSTLQARFQLLQDSHAPCQDDCYLGLL